LNLPGWTIERSLARGPKVSDIAARLGNIPVKSLPLLFESSASLNHSAHLSTFLNSLENGVGDYSDILLGDPEARSLFLQALRIRQGKLRSCHCHAKEQGERMVPRLCPPEPRERRPGPDQLELARTQLEAATDAHKLAIAASAVFSVRRARLAAAREWYVAQERFARASSRAGPHCLGGDKRLALERLSEVETGWLERTGQLLLAAGQQDLSTQLAGPLPGGSSQSSSRTNPQRIRNNQAPRPLPEETEAETAPARRRLQTEFGCRGERLAEDAGRADQVVAETRVALSEAQSTMIKLERARAGNST
jgi:hypothetical protein